MTGLQKNDEVWVFEHFDDGDLARKEFLQEFARSVTFRDDFDGDVCLVMV